MKIRFHKYQGTGNDFVMIDNRSDKIKLSSNAIQAICDRRFGIGADGIILLEKHSSLDFNMNYYNADGSQSFCGNGSRCVVKFAEALGLIDKQTNYLAIDGEHRSVIHQEEVATEMQPVHRVEKIDRSFFIHTGSPHYIIFTDHLNQLDLIAEAHKIRYSDTYREEGVNVNFVQVEGDHIQVRTYERGVENETLSCGTGVTAVAIAHCEKMKLHGSQELKIQTRGGLLRIVLKEHQGGYTNIQLVGPATKVFEGEIEL